jgi:hypothetical protein
MDMTWANAAVVSSICGVVATALTLFYKFVMAALREAHASQDETIRALLTALVGTSGAEAGLGHAAMQRLNGKVPGMATLAPPAPKAEPTPIVNGVSISRGD